MVSYLDYKRYSDSIQVTGKHFCIAPSQTASSLLPNSPATEAQVTSPHLTSPHPSSQLPTHMHHNNKSIHYSDSVTIHCHDSHEPSAIDSPKWGQHDQQHSALVVNTASTRKYAARSSARHVRLPRVVACMPLQYCQYTETTYLLAQLRVKGHLYSKRHIFTVQLQHGTQRFRTGT